MYIPKILFDKDSGEVPIMKEFSMYTYQGSLSAPPCTERTIRYVHADPIGIGTVTLELFKEALRIPDLMDSKGNVIISDVLPINNRRIQNINGRSIFYYLADKEDNYFDRKPKHRTSGHYEKLKKKTTEFYYVNNQHPSGMPGALVVSSAEAKGSRR